MTSLSVLLLLLLFRLGVAALAAAAVGRGVVVELVSSSQGHSRISILVPPLKMISGLDSQ